MARENAACIKGSRAKATVTFAADVPAALHYAVDPLTNPGPVCRIIRWYTHDFVHGGVLVTRISRDAEGTVTLAVGAGRDVQDPAFGVLP